LAERRVAVVGLGNLLMGDDGVGVEVIRRLEGERLGAGVKLIDGGTAVHETVHETEGYATVVIIDAVHGGGEPGTVYRMTLEETRSRARKDALPVSLHQLSALSGLALGEIAGWRPEKVVIIGVEPKDVGLRLGLSPDIEQRMPAIMDVVRREIEPGRRSLEEST